MEPTPPQIDGDYKVRALQSVVIKKCRKSRKSGRKPQRVGGFGGIRVSRRRLSRQENDWPIRRRPVSTPQATTQENRNRQVASRNRYLRSPGRCDSAVAVLPVNYDRRFHCGLYLRQDHVAYGTGPDREDATSECWSCRICANADRLPYRGPNAAGVARSPMPTGAHQPRE